MAEISRLIGFVPARADGPQLRGPCPVHGSRSKRSRVFSASKLRRVRSTCKLFAWASCSAKDGCCNPSTCVVVTSTSYVCRPTAPESVGCDVPETCPGTGPACPADHFVAAGTVCRPSAGECDPTETCSGTVPSCPADAKQASGMPCTDDKNPYVYLSDGGHFENLGLYEMVLRRCHTIVVSDAGCDPGCSFEDLGNAIRKIRIDFGIPIELEDVLKIDEGSGFRSHVVDHKQLQVSLISGGRHETNCFPAMRV